MLRSIKKKSEGVLYLKREWYEEDCVWEWETVQRNFEQGLICMQQNNPLRPGMS